MKVKVSASPTIPMRCRRQHHNFPLSTFHLQLKSPYPKIGAKSRGTTLIHPTDNMGHLRRSVTGAPVPVIPGDAKVACRTHVKGLPPFPLSLNGQLNLLLFRIVFAYRKYSTTKCGNVNDFYRHSMEKAQKMEFPSPDPKGAQPVLRSLAAWAVFLPGM